MSRSHTESDSVHPSPPSLTLLRLPAEIRHQIYSFAIPVTRLCRRKYCSANPKARYHCLYRADRLGYDEPRTVSNLLYVCRSTYQDCSPILYSKAILEIAPIRLPGHLTTDLLGTSVDQNYPLLARALEAEYSFLPEHSKQLIHTAYVWTHDGHGTTTATLTALLRWILRNLNPQEIHISAPVTQYLYLRQRYGRSPLQLTHNQDIVTTLRAICDQEIWATRASLQPQSGKLELATSATRRIPHVHVFKKRWLGDRAREEL